MPRSAPGLDHLGSRRLGAIEQALWYAVAAISYVGLGMFHKWLLNWFVGPVWLVTVAALGPALLDRLRRRPL